jgi:hypothetical protein
MVSIEQITELKNAIAEIQQPRSNFALENFVVKQHLVPEMQYFQILIELQNLIYTYEDARLSSKIQEIKIQRLKSTGDEIDSLEAEKLQLGLDQTKVVAIGAEREILTLINLYKSYPKFSREQIEAAQPAYWKERLFGNAEAMLMGGAGVNPSHIESMKQAGILDQFINHVEESKNAFRNLES